MPRRYSLTHVALHWTMAAVVAAAWILGSLIEDFARGEARDSALGSHALLGLAVGALLLPRLLVRRAGAGLRPEVSPSADASTRWQDRLAVAVHHLLYALMALMPLTGVASAMSRRRPVHIPGLFDIPTLLSGLGLTDPLEGLHSLLGNVLLGAVGLHVAATLYHHVIRRDDVAGRMIPWLAR